LAVPSSVRIDTRSPRTERAGVIASA
jgi:hypothetical protein